MDDLLTYTIDHIATRIVRNGWPENNRIQYIKELRAVTGAGLTDSKNAVEKATEKMQARDRTRSIVSQQIERFVGNNPRELADSICSRLEQEGLL